VYWREGIGEENSGMNCRMSQLVTQRFSLLDDGIKRGAIWVNAGERGRIDLLLEENNPLLAVQQTTKFSSATTTRRNEFYRLERDIYQ
jgi:hypothetical protein